MARPTAQEMAIKFRQRDERRASCICHRENGSHELCCGHEGGRNPDCPQHGDQ